MAYVGKTPKFEGVTVSKTASGASVPVSVANNSNTASSKAVISATVAGASADDAVYQAVVSGVTTWSWGVDNSASDAWVLSAGATLGTNNAISVSTSGVPTLTTPVLGVATATSINKVAITAPATGSTLTVADGKTLTASNTLTFTGTDSSTVAFGAGGTAAYVDGALGNATATTLNKVTLTTPATGSTLTVADGKTLTASNTLTMTATDGSTAAFGAGGTVAYVANKLSAFAATTSSELAGVISDETGTGSLVFNAGPAFTTLSASADANPVAGFANSAASASSSSRIVAARFTTDDDCIGGYFYSCTNKANSTIGRIEAASNTTVSYTTSSDKRIKTALSQFNGLDILDSLAVGSFQWKDKPSDAGPRPLSDKEIERGGNGVEYGVLAQDAFAVFPQAVSVGTDELTEDGHLETPWAVDYSKFVPVLMDAVKRLAARVAELEAK
jgi:hypothetical protein